MTLLDGPKAAPPDVIERRVREMGAVRQLAARARASRDGRWPVQLTEDEWLWLCGHARGADDVGAAVARVIKAADGAWESSSSQGLSQPPVRAANVAPTVIPSIHPRLQDRSSGEAATDVLIPTEFGVPQIDEATLDVLAPEPPSMPQALAGHSNEHMGENSALRQGERFRRRNARRLGFRPLDDRRRERWLTIASWVRNIGLIILLFVAWQLWGTGISQHHSQEALKKQFQAKVGHVTTKPSPTFTLTPATTRIADPPDGQAMAKLQIPAIGVDQYVVSGTDAGDLTKGPGHYLGTAMPGQAGNVAIAGHRTTHGAPFNRLAQLTIGDSIYLTTLSGQQLTYIVSAAPVAVSPSDVTVLNNFGDNRLTLTTCNPEYSAVQRLIVVAAYQPPGTSQPEPIAMTPGKPYVLATNVSDGWNLSQLPLALLLGGLLAALGVFFRRLSRTYGRQSRWLILIPIWLALLLALFETLANVLPASV